jgi:hypothetical protein
MNYFITFSNHKYIGARKRIIDQANYLFIFDKIIEYDEHYLQSDNFWNQHSTFILNNKRGYGYWLWKPYLILKTLEMMNENDILLYCDSGCELDINQKENIKKMFEITNDDLIVGSFTEHNEISYCKKELFEYLNMDETFYDTIQHQATALCIKKTQKTLDLITEWYTTCCQYNFIDDTKSKISNEHFIDNRHDQSVFSLLTKKYNLFSKYSLSNCIYLDRNRTAKSLFNLPDGSWINSAIDYFIENRIVYAYLKNNKNKYVLNLLPAYKKGNYQNDNGKFI